MRLGKLAADLLLLLVAIVWGTTFPIVKSALSTIEPMWFLAIRFAFAALFLVPPFVNDIRRAPLLSWRNGAVIGLALFAGYAFQTVGLSMTTASKTAFITGLYLVIVPLIIALWTRRAPRLDVTLGVASAAVGLGLLSLEGGLWPGPGDLLVFFCAIAFACHIIAVDKLGRGHSAGVITIAQILVVSLLSLGSALLFEKPLSYISPKAWGAILATGILATSVAFLIQNSVQRFTTPTHAALIFALEPVFAAIFSYWWAGEQLTGRGWSGAALMFAGMMIVEFEPLAQVMTRLYCQAYSKGRG